jgi:hypothetical protein
MKMPDIFTTKDACMNLHISEVHKVLCHYFAHFL